MRDDIIDYFSFLLDTDENEIFFSEKWLRDENASQEKKEKQKKAFQKKEGQRNRLIELYNEIKKCHLCSLAETRKQMVFGAGYYNADVMLVGEAPGRKEDERGYPFVGEAGKLLDKMLAAIQLDRKSIFISNVLKCRPPENRNPEKEEIIACLPYLIKQIEIISPKIILCLGVFAARTLLQTTSPLHALRQKVFPYNDRKVLVTYHPSALLRNNSYKRPAWEDLKLLKRTIENERDPQ